MWKGGDWSWWEGPEPADLNGSLFCQRAMRGPGPLARQDWQQGSRSRSEPEQMFGSETNCRFLWDDLSPSETGSLLKLPVEALTCLETLLGSGLPPPDGLHSAE